MVTQTDVAQTNVAQGFQTCSAISADDLKKQRRLRHCPSRFGNPRYALPTIIRFPLENGRNGQNGIGRKIGDAWTCVALATLCSESRGFQPTEIKKAAPPSRSDGSMPREENRRDATDGDFAKLSVG
jgi:hypothetical protein